LVVRPAREDDRAAVLDFASRTWDGWDYIPHAWPHWLAATDSVFLVATAGPPPSGAEALDTEGSPIAAGRPIAIARVAMLSPTEAWLEGIRVDPRVRGLDVATDLQVAELRWAAEHGAKVVRYATSSRNEASHRLGARHGFELLTALRTWWWTDPALGDPDADGHDDDEESGFDDDARAEATARRQRALARLADRGLVASADRSDLWPLVAADPTFLAGRRLYESRPWALALLDEDRFRDHLAAGEVVFGNSGEAGWALAIFEREAQPSEDLSLHLSLFVGHGAAALELANQLQPAVDGSIRFRLPDPDPPLLDGHADAFANAGFRAREWTLHILGRPIDADHPPPEPDGP
jgi:GNAT superfamily N-acetyltransferase